MKLKIGEREAQPTQMIRWPVQGLTILQQIKTAAQPSRITLGPVSQIISANMPKPVVITGIIKNKVNATTRQLTISFLRDPADTYFHKVNVHFRQGVGLPVQIGSGSTSPIRVTLPVSTAPTTILLQAEGNWGAHPIENSPVRPVSLL